MDKREVLLNLRKSRKLKGLKPCFVYLKNNIGKIYNEGRAKFIMSYDKGVLYFQKLTFFNNINEDDDFYLNCKRFVSLEHIDNGIFKVLRLIDKNNLFIDIYYKARRKDSISTEDNILRIIEELKKLNIVEVKDGEN